MEHCERSHCFFSVMPENRTEPVYGILNESLYQLERVWSYNNGPDVEVLKNENG